MSCTFNHNSVGPACGAKFCNCESEGQFWTGLPCLLCVYCLFFRKTNKLAIALVAWEWERWSCKTRKTAPFPVGGGGIKLSGLETRIRMEVRISFALQRAEKIISTSVMATDERYFKLQGQFLPGPNHKNLIPVIRSARLIWSIFLGL